MATAAGRASRRSGRKRGGRWWRLVPAGLIVPILGWLGGFVIFVEGAPNREPVVREPTDAIVVLTGGSDRVRIGVARVGAHSRTQYVGRSVAPSGITSVPSCSP